jgi:glycerol-3-phosphate acyltransferase PlsX
MTDNYRIALDAMGGDLGHGVVVEAAVKSLTRFADIELILVGDETLIGKELSRLKQDNHSRLSIHHATQVVDMDDEPRNALRNKKGSSMRLAINLVKEGAANACVSGGNTGALMATAKFVLKMLPGIDRPAITATIPSINGQTHMLDLGANVDALPDQLFQFAVMGAELVTAVEGVSNPRVGLLNMGQEAFKGNDKVKDAGRMLEESDLNYIGFVEGDDITMGDVDVVVCDGFVGNVSLKSMEGVAKLITTYMKEEFTRSLLARLVAFISLPLLKSMKRRMDPRNYNGASLLGLQGIVIKSHGGSDSVAFANAIKIARLEAMNNVPARIDKHIETMLNSQKEIS